MVVLYTHSTKVDALNSLSILPPDILVYAVLSMKLEYLISLISSYI